MNKQKLQTNITLIELFFPYTTVNTHQPPALGPVVSVSALVLLPLLWAFALMGVGAPGKQNKNSFFNQRLTEQSSILTKAYKIQSPLP